MKSSELIRRKRTLSAHHRRVGRTRRRGRADPGRCRLPPHADRRNCGGARGRRGRVPRAREPTVATVNARPESEAMADAMVEKAVETHGRLDILVVASGINRVGMIDEMAPDAFADVMDANVTQSWLLARAATRRMKAQGDGGKDRPRLLDARDSRPSRRATPPIARRRRRWTASRRRWPASWGRRESP